MSSFEQKITKHTKPNPHRNVWTIKRKNKLTETVLKNDMTADLLLKNFKTTILKILKELKESMEKVRKMIYQQNGNIN